MADGGMTANFRQRVKMPIANNNSGNSALSKTAQAAETEPNGSRGKETAAAASSFSDGIQITQFPEKLSKALESGSTSRSQRVDWLAAAVQSGTYQVGVRAVSRAILDHAVSLRPVIS